MTHGNKKYFFDKLKEVGDSMVVEPKNIYSLKNQAKLFIKENNPSIKFDYQDQRGGKVLVTRIA